MGIYGKFAHRLLESKVKEELEKQKDHIDKDVIDNYRNEKGAVPTPSDLPKRPNRIYKQNKEK